MVSRYAATKFSRNFSLKKKYVQLVTLQWKKQNFKQRTCKPITACKKF